VGKTRIILYASTADLSFGGQLPIHAGSWPITGTGGGFKPTSACTVPRLGLAVHSTHRRNAGLGPDQYPEVPFEEGFTLTSLALVEVISAFLR
jgi:hypothetical protein